MRGRSRRAIASASSDTANTAPTPCGKRRVSCWRKSPGGSRFSASAGGTPPRAKSTRSATSIRFSPTKSSAVARPMPASTGTSPGRRFATWNSRWIAAACRWRRFCRQEHWSRNPFRLTQTFDERRPQQECPRPHRILGGAAQLVLIAFTHRGVLLGQQPLVADGLRLGMLNSNVAALPFVAVENFLALFAAQDLDEFVGKIESVVDAAVHSHGPDRAIHMGGVAREDCPADPKLLRHPLMHGVEIAGHDIEVAAGRQEALQARLQRFRTADRLPILRRIHRKMHPPAIGRSLPMEQV